MIEEMRSYVLNLTLAILHDHVDTVATLERILRKFVALIVLGWKKCTSY